MSGHDESWVSKVLNSRRKELFYDQIIIAVYDR